MASPTARRSVNQFGSVALPTRMHLPLILRRWGAWTIEISLIAASTIGPYKLGEYAKTHFSGEMVPLNAALVTTQETIAKTLALPLGEESRMAAPLTNLFWSSALLLPLTVAGVNLYFLSKTGKTIPKAWLNVRVVTAEGKSPGWGRALIREGLGRWGLPLGLAYTIWRYSGAFPGLGILSGLAGVVLLAECASALFNSRRRGFHDYLAGTYVVDASQRFPSADSWRETGTWQKRGVRSPEWIESKWTEEDAAIAAIVLTPESDWQERQSLWMWMRQHPGLSLLSVALTSLGLVLGTFVGTQVYVQNQANRREFQQQNNQIFLALVSKLTPLSNSAPDERRSAILALGTIDDPRALPLLVDLLSQERSPALIDAIQQAVVRKGPTVLPSLRRLNQALRNELESLRNGGIPNEQFSLTLRQRATQRAIAKIFTLYSGQLGAVDMSRVDLGQITPGATRFTLVLDQVDLAGMQFKAAVLTNARLRGSRFYGVGEDDRWGTFDDLITDLSGADLKDADLTSALLTNAIMHRTSLIRATLTHANLSNARLIGANLGSAKLVGANLRQAILTEASLAGADLTGADFSQANLRAARLGQASALDATFQFANLAQSDWKGADLSGADLSQANLQEASFASARLMGTALNQAQLQNASFRYADLTQTDLRGAILDGADFQGATFVAIVPMSSSQFVKSAPSPAQTPFLRGVNFSKVRNLSPDQITYLCAQGAQHPKCSQ